MPVTTTNSSRPRRTTCRNDLLAHLAVVASPERRKPGVRSRGRLAGDRTGTRRGVDSAVPNGRRLALVGRIGRRARVLSVRDLSAGVDRREPVNWISRSRERAQHGSRSFHEGRDRTRRLASRSRATGMSRLSRRAVIGSIGAVGIGANGQRSVEKGPRVVPSLSAFLYSGVSRSVESRSSSNSLSRRPHSVTSLYI